MTTWILAKYVQDFVLLRMGTDASAASSQATDIRCADWQSSISTTSQRVPADGCRAGRATYSASQALKRACYSMKDTCSALARTLMMEAAPALLFGATVCTKMSADDFGGQFLHTSQEQEHAKSYPLNPKAPNADPAL